jgi:hypothetical protein
VQVPGLRVCGFKPPVAVLLQPQRARSHPAQPRPAPPRRRRVLAGRRSPCRITRAALGDPAAPRLSPDTALAFQIPPVLLSEVQPQRRTWLASANHNLFYIRKGPSRR